MRKVVLLLLIGLVFSCSDDTPIPQIIQPCQPVVASFTSDITDNSAQLNWCGSVNESGECLPVTGVSWTVSWGTPGFDPDTGTIINTPSTSASIGGLTAQTSYEFYVKSDCNLANNEWFGPVEFRTSCPAPTNLGVNNITQTGATFTWSPGGNEVSWEIKYGFVGFNLEEAELFATGNNTEHSVANLQPNTDYEFYVRANCNTVTDGSQIGSSSAFSGPFRFSTCLPPINLSIDSFTQNSVSLDWDSNSQTTWEVRYGEVAGFDPATATVVTTNNSNYTVTGLCPNTLYTFAVRTLCGTTTQSQWIGFNNVNTLPLGYTGTYMYEEIGNTDEPIFGDPVNVDITSVSDTERSITVKYLANLDVTGTQPTMTFNFTLNCDGTVSVPDDQDTNFNCGGDNVLLGQGTAMPTNYNMVDDNTIDIRFVEDTGSATCTNAALSEVTIRLTKI
ncbi:fibronectin type III domain-containing protein [Kordia zhangzhouensis]|uniref:fibronectin type III domain-containing protein n=1 Tax=Kordia zhangzhouensis TaxID=1620405 RepID=UPI00138E169B|nr:fibronectin type III domain-containing protein [Kordia zhangzhouensis]